VPIEHRLYGSAAPRFGCFHAVLRSRGGDHPLRDLRRLKLQILAGTSHRAHLGSLNPQPIYSSNFQHVEVHDSVLILTLMLECCVECCLHVQCAVRLANRHQSSKVMLSGHSILLTCTGLIHVTPCPACPVFMLGKFRKHCRARESRAGQPAAAWNSHGSESVPHAAHFGLQRQAARGHAWTSVASNRYKTMAQRTPAMLRFAVFTEKCVALEFRVLL
jgi:hypothetical protein